MIKDALLINSYAGSLLAAAMELRVPIRGSFETAGYGQEIQRFNAPKLNYVAKTADWPKQDLSDTLVIGHPPCSAFSTLNTPMRKKNQDDAMASINSPAFQCTKDLLDYSMENGAGMIMVESVPRAMTEAASIHEYYASKFGYSLIRVMQSATCYGLPQNRKRFWAVFAKEPGRRFTVKVPNLTPPFLKDVITQEGEPFADHQRQQSGYDGRMAEKYDDVTRRAIWSGEYGFGKLQDVLARMGPTKDDPAQAAWAKHVIVNRWSVSSGNLLHPEKLAPVVLQCSLWFFDGKPLTLSDFFKIMGYPTWYRYPEAITKTTNSLGYLSRGVCPPIVKWLIRQFAAEVIGSDAGEDYKGGEASVADGETLDVISINKMAGKPAKKERGERVTTTTRASRGPVDYGVNPLAPEAVIA